MERRTLPGEPNRPRWTKCRRFSTQLSAEDPTFRGSATAMFSRPAYESAARSRTAAAAGGGAVAALGGTPRMTGASFWTDAAVLGHAGIPSILFGPGGAGLHSTEEYVNRRRCACAATRWSSWRPVLLSELIRARAAARDSSSGVRHRRRVAARD